ncbi:MAG TPA: hypothetical protein VFG76_11845, partial [Candidatus Polarisedimenticolia bacterium]|nr:hypothetical protein [Candidatus Polarisedimenticolia bacterium]
LLPAAGLIFLVTAVTRAQIGVRYVLPVIPLLCLAGAACLPGRGIVGGAGRAGRAVRGIVAALLLWHAVSAVRIHPYHLAYFNEAAGGPDGGRLHLSDSNVDWGQDLTGVAEFVRDQGLSSINLYYFGTADPEYYGIRRQVPPAPGYFAVSATHLAGIYAPDRDMLAAFRELAPERSFGHSILLYHLDHVPDSLRPHPKEPTHPP